MFTVGIDIGSKTLKLVALDAAGGLAFSSYELHKADVRAALAAALRECEAALGAAPARVAFTGSAALALAAEVGAEHVQEVVACAAAVRAACPAADAVIELGGEDAKIVYLGEAVEQRMNAACAGGTGAFIDAVACMLGVTAAEIDGLAAAATRRYPIASRCAVFAQTDIRPLLAAGAEPADIAASALDAIVRQTLGGLACGRPVRGNVVFLGGPFEYIPSLVRAFREALGLDEATGVKPESAQLFPAVGTALSARTATSLPELIARVEALRPAEDLECLPALFGSAAELAEFEERHAGPHFACGAASGPVFLGVDAGSTTVKLAVVNLRGQLVWSDYRFAQGATLECVRQMLAAAREALPGCEIVRSAVCGYGEDMLRAELGIDEGVVETSAHLRAAAVLVDGVDFVLDIGGQDMKALWVGAGGCVADTALNEACSSGCGAFIEETARSLGETSASLARLALAAKQPVDLGIRCTVFMNSRVRQAQKAGASREDIAAGISWAVVKNALYRIVGRRRVAALRESGATVVVSGGTFQSPAVLRALELELGMEVVRPAESHLMGAIGCALMAREAGEVAAVAEGTPPNVIAREQELLAAFASQDASGPRAKVAVGLMNTNDFYVATPFWHTLFASLGFGVRVPRVGCEVNAPAAAAETVPSESVCHPAKVAHARYFDLCEQGAQAVIFPRAQRKVRCAVATNYAQALADNLRGAAVPLITPELFATKPRAFTRSAEARRNLFAAVAELALQAGAPLTQEEFDAAMDAGMAAQTEFARARGAYMRSAFEWLDANPTRQGVVLAGRPYHSDPSLLRGIDRQLTELGFAVFCLSDFSERLRRLNDADDGPYPWFPMRPVRDTARFVAEHPQLDMVLLQSFGCAYDALSCECGRELLAAAGRPSLIIKIDEIMDAGHIRVRLRTLAEAVRGRRASGTTPRAAALRRGQHPRNSSGGGGENAPAQGRIQNVGAGGGARGGSRRPGAPAAR